MDQSTQAPENSQSANVLKAQGVLDATKPYTDLLFEDGRMLRLDTHRLVAFHPAPESDEVGLGGSPNDLVIPLIEEQLTVGKRIVPTGSVILEKTVQEYEHRLDEPLAIRTYDIERKILNRTIEDVPLIRQEGDITIYPVVEEKLILTKQLVLKEEIHVTRRDDTRVDNQVVTLKREHLTVRRKGAEPDR